MVEDAARLLHHALEGAKARQARELARCARACFFDEQGGLSLEGGKLLADMREHARLFASSIGRNRSGSIDRDEMLRIEGRREITLRLINLLELDPFQVARIVEVDDGRT